MPEVKNDTALDEHVIKTLLYYDIFNYPLKSSEVFRFLGMNSVSEKEVTDSLNMLTYRHYLFRFGEYYSLQQDRANVTRRINGNREAKKYLHMAFKRAAFISKFPFVRAVMASGSLSKDYMDENCDLDFFIITSAGRLWICRTLLVLYKRLFLKNSHKFFCVNYFVDADHVEIEEKNLFTATELATVIPLYGAEFYQLLQENNRSWLMRYFPNFRNRDTSQVPVSKTGWSKRILEGGVNIFFGGFLEKLFMNITLRRWRKLYQESFEKTDFAIAFKTKSYASKNHPRNFQKKVMEVYAQKLKIFSEKFDMELR